MAPVFVFLGDSITDAHRLWLPETHGLGNGYVSMLQKDLLLAGRDVRFLNKGHDGFTVPALLRNLALDGLPEQARFISVLIGINDVGVAQNTGVSLKDLHFAEDYARLLDILRARKEAALLCVGPFLFTHPQKYLLWMRDVKEAEETIAALAGSYSIPFLPLQDRLNAAAKECGYDAITTDGIHLTCRGHRLLADLIRPYLPSD